MSILKGTGNVLKTILGGAMQKHPIRTPVALGATAAAGLGVLGNEDSGWVGRNTKNSDDAFGEELKKWENKPWDPDNDPEYVNKTMQRLHREMTNELDTMLVPRSSASEEATDYVLAFLQMAQKKEGAPTMTGVEDERVIYDNNPYTKNLPSGDTMNVGDFG